jgi:hypothetical protein
MIDILSEQLILPTRRAPNEIQRLLSESVAPSGTFKWWSPPKGGNKPYEGELANFHFHIRRVVGHRNDMLPYIDGNITLSGTGSIIRARIQPQRLIKVGIILWTTLLSLFGIALVIARASTGGLDFQSFLPFAVAGFGYLVGYLSYAGEAKQAKAFLNRLANDTD